MCAVSLFTPPAVDGSCAFISAHRRTTVTYAHYFRRPRPPLQGVPDKGKVLTKISLFWFEKLEHIIPTHLVTADVGAMPAEVGVHADVLAGRAMLVKKARVVPLEAIVRGYITGDHCSYLALSEKKLC